MVERIDFFIDHIQYFNYIRQIKGIANSDSLVVHLNKSPYGFQFDANGKFYTAVMYSAGQEFLKVNADSEIKLGLTTVRDKQLLIPELIYCSTEGGRVIVLHGGKTISIHRRPFEIYLDREQSFYAIYEKFSSNRRVPIQGLTPQLV